MIDPRAVQSFSVETLTIPLKRPFVTALGRKTETCNVVFMVKLRDGSEGYGEASASLALAHLRPKHLASVLRTLGRASLGKEPTRALIEKAWKTHGRAAPAVSAFECALLTAQMRSNGLTLSDWLGGARRSLESDITLSASGGDAAVDAAREAAREGFKVLKIKVGGEFELDFLRVQAAVSACKRKKPRVILDGNQGMTVSSSLRLVEACLDAGIVVDLLEQPLPKTDFKGMAAVARLSTVPVAADEMVMTPEDAVRVADERAADVLNIKVAKSGILRSLEISAVARAAGLELMIGCMAETARGLSPSVHLAAGTGFFRYVDLDSDHLLAGGGKARDWRREGPFLNLR